MSEPVEVKTTDSGDLRRRALLCLDESIQLHDALVRLESEAGVASPPSTVLLYQPFFPTAHPPESGWFGRFADISSKPADSDELVAARELEPPLKHRAEVNFSHPVFTGLCQPSNVGMSYLVSTNQVFMRAPWLLERVRVQEAYENAKENAAFSTAIEEFGKWDNGDPNSAFNKAHRKRYTLDQRGRTQRSPDGTRSTKRKRVAGANAPTVPGVWSDHWLWQAPLKVGPGVLNDKGLPWPRLGTIYSLTQNDPNDFPYHFGETGQSIANALLRKRIDSIAKLDETERKALKSDVTVLNAKGNPGLSRMAVNQTWSASRQKEPLETLAQVVLRIWLNADYLWPTDYSSLVLPSPSTAGRSPLHKIAREMWGGLLRHKDVDRRQITLSLFAFWTGTDVRDWKAPPAAIQLVDLVLQAASLSMTCSTKTAHNPSLAAIRSCLDSHATDTPLPKDHTGCGTLFMHNGGEILHGAWPGKDSHGPDILRLICACTEEHYTLGKHGQGPV